VGAKRLRNYFKTVNMELTTIARACGKQDVHHLEKEDLVALTVEAAAMAGVPLAGTSWIPVQPGHSVGARQANSVIAICVKIVRCGSRLGVRVSAQAPLFVLAL